MTTGDDHDPSTPHSSLGTSDPKGCLSENYKPLNQLSRENYVDMYKYMMNYNWQVLSLNQNGYKLIRMVLIM